MWTVGKPTATQKQYLAEAATLTENTERKIRPGMNGDEVSKLTMEVAKELKIGNTASPFGHAIGMEIVENPILLPDSRAEIKAGAALCVEPGLELPTHQGIHFEDELFVKASRISGNNFEVHQGFFLSSPRVTTFIRKRKFP